jgi:hypothetical protein
MMVLHFWNRRLIATKLQTHHKQNSSEPNLTIAQ